MSSPASRLSKISGALASSSKNDDVPWNPDRTEFPTRRNLPSIPGAPPGAAWVWGKDDGLGRLNLLTPTRVAAAAKDIKTGEVISVNMPLHLPSPTIFKRDEFIHTIKSISPGIAYDDLYSLNTQSGTQWDGFRHFAHIPTKTFYNGGKGSDHVGPTANLKNSLHHWAEHGIAGRGILLDYWGYAQANGIHYDPFSKSHLSHDQTNTPTPAAHSIPHASLLACATAQSLDARPAAQGGDVRPGDVLFVRSGFGAAYAALDADGRAALAARKGRAGQYAGLAQEEAVVDWLHDCWFAAVAGDAPSFEAWPSGAGYHLHEHLLALWGVPIGEMLDLERLAQRCRELGRWTFFFTSAPANVHGGVGTHVNGLAIL